MTAQRSQPRDAPTERLWRAVIVLGVLGTVAGAVALALALIDGVGFVERGIDARVWWFHHANPLGGLLIFFAGAAGVVAGALRSPAVALLAAVGVLAIGGVVAFGQAVGANVLGGSASTLGLCLGLGGGLFACALTAWAAEP